MTDMTTTMSDAGLLMMMVTKANDGKEEEEEKVDDDFNHDIEELFDYFVFSAAVGQMIHFLLCSL